MLITPARVPFVASTYFVLALATGCGADASSAPDAESAPPSLDVRGQFAVTSSFVFATRPPELAPLLARLEAATDGPDDPSRYLVDLVIARLPDGDSKRVAEFLAPSIAAYAQARIDAFAPRLAPGLRALTAGLARLTTQFGAREELVIDEAGRVAHTLIALDVDGRALTLGEHSAHARAELDGDRVTIGAHALPIDVAEIVRVGFGRAVIPSVVPGAEDLGTALTQLVDCDALGAVIEEQVVLGSPELYAHACRLGLAVGGAELEARLPASLPLAASLQGSARAVDRDGDGRVDTLESGRWEAGSLQGSFTGARR